MRDRYDNPHECSHILGDRDLALDALDHLADWRADVRDDWLRVGMALHDVDPELFEVWDSWSQKSDKYDPRATRTAWRNFRRGGGVGLGTLCFMAREDAPWWGRGERRAMKPRTKARPAPRPVETRPPRGEVLDLWNASAPVTTDPVAVSWLRSRELDAERVEDRDLARVLPQGYPLPTWARCKGTDWALGGWRLLVPLFGPTGEIESLHARRLVAGEPKGASPAGFRVRGLAFADVLGRALLETGECPGWWEAGPLWVYVTEGVPDLLTAASGFSEADTGAPATLGLISGNWTQAVADRVPTGAVVTVATHHDPTGHRYADLVRRTVGARCSFRRVGGAA